jgi:hypothetical protein
LRVTRDQRGYENTFLLHSARPGDPPRVLYWYRTAPGVRVGRRALDEDAIREIEEQHPDIEFDWPHLLEEASNPPIDIERRPERPRRKPQRARDEEATAAPAPAMDSPPSPAPAAAVAPPAVPSPPAGVAPAGRLADEPRPPNPLLEQLVGREIAARLRARYAEISARIGDTPPGQAQDAWRQRADALDPDRWETPEAILEGIGSADRRFEELKRELP